MRYGTLRIGLIGLIFLFLGSAGCATRSYVRRQVMDLRAAMTVADDSLDAGLQGVRGLAADADSRATAAVQGLRSAQDLALGRVGYREVNRYQVYFAFDSAEPEASSAAVLERVKDQISRNPHLLVELYGFADPTGPAAYNLELGRRRAESVLRDLADRVPGRLGRFQAVSFGETPPVQEMAGLGAGGQRRQVEIVLVERTRPEEGGEAITSSEPTP